MARPPRRELAGGIHHVTARGNNGDPIFRDATDHRIFQRLLARTAAKFAWKCLTYCLMGNHYHLLVTTVDATLSRGMQWLNGRYAQWLNWRHGSEGHAFFRRFKSVEIESDEQLAEVARYIVLNPVRAGLCAAPEDWRWSSYRAMVGREPVPSYLACDWLVGQFGFELGQAQANFAAFVATPTVEASP